MRAARLRASARACVGGCGVMAGIGSAMYTGGVGPGDSVAVIGCGGVGDAAILGSRLAGATRIIAVEPAGEQCRHRGHQRHRDGRGQFSSLARPDGGRRLRLDL